MEGINWAIFGTDQVGPKEGAKGVPLRIIGRHHFTSALKRMSAVVRVTRNDEEELWGLVKVSALHQTWVPSVLGEAFIYNNNGVSGSQL